MAKHREGVEMATDRRLRQFEETVSIHQVEPKRIEFEKLSIQRKVDRLCELAGPSSDVLLTIGGVHQRDREKFPETSSVALLVHLKNGKEYRFSGKPKVILLEAFDVLILSGHHCHEERFRLAHPVSGGYDWWAINDMENQYAVVTVKASLSHAEEIARFAFDKIKETA